VPARQPAPAARLANGALLRRRDWLSDGACRDEDPELFFPISSAGPAIRQILAAKAVCGRCEVRQECLCYALEDTHSHGVWGGTTEEERKAIRAQARAEPSPQVTAVAS
jgi:WhiB family redox-sensing transcriptional regulator